MTNISRLNKKLERTFGGAVHAELRDGCLYLSGELPDWDKVVQAGKMSVNKKKYTVVNDIKFTGGEIPAAKMPAVSSNRLAGARPHALVVGGGVVGCAIARELMRYKLDIMLVEKERDVALHASGRNDGMVLPGICLRKGQLKKKYTDAGNRIFSFVCRKLGVPFRNTGQYLCFYGGWMKPAAFLSLLYWKLTGIPAKYVSRRRLTKREPLLSDKIKFAIFFPTAGAVDPHELTIAYAENAADNGAKICLDTAVIDIDVWNGKVVSILTNHGRIYPKLVINAAGMFAEDIARLARDRFFSIYPKKGANMVFDKKAAFLVNTTACFTGISAATYEEDFIVSFGKYTKNIIHAAGIQSPGLTAAPAIAVDVALMAAKYFGAKINEKFNPARKAIVRAAESPVAEVQSASHYRR
ncbi:MAG: FAD-dependent oxidoreductase [Treponema sp.]|jgi:glycerol-3-phosphate dehydrogenase|nr:FAD-dependent oxidoreductase [Treponema sp.]